MSAGLPVYLIHWNRPEWCAAAVRSLRASTLAVDVTIVDNSARASPPLRSALGPEPRILESPRNLGYAGGANLALNDWARRRADAPYAVVGSHDLHVEPGALAALVAEADARPSFGILAPALLRPRESSGGTWEGHHEPRQFALTPHGEFVEREWASGTCLLLRRTCAARVGAFDARFGSYMEDVDYCLRARDAGWKVGVVQRARAWGLGSAIGEETWSMMEANTVLLVAKREGTLAALQTAGTLLGWTVRSALGSLAPWRSATERATSAAFRRRHGKALILLAERLRPG